MTTTNPNPLDRIRSTAPADMTDDELGNGALGVSVLLAGGASVEYAEKDDYGNIVDSWFVEYGDGELCVTLPARFPWNAQRHFWRRTRRGETIEASNPALSYDALLPIVREWVGSDRMRCLNALWALLPLLKAGGNMGATGDWPVHNETDLIAPGFLAVILSTPRQLAEAFVTAAREVG